MQLVGLVQGGWGFQEGWVGRTRARAVRFIAGHEGSEGRMGGQWGRNRAKSKSLKEAKS